MSWLPLMLAVALAVAIRIGWAMRQRGLAAHVRALGGTTANSDHQITRRDVTVVLRPKTVSRHDQYQELTATVPAPSELRISIRRDWDRRPLPPLGKDLWTMPIRRQDQFAVIRSETVASLDEIDGLDAPIAKLAPLVSSYVLACDHDRVIAWVDADLERASVDLLVEAITILARWDRGLTATLLGLPDAAPLSGHELDPGVSFGTDGLVLGVVGGARTVAQLDGAELEETDQTRAFVEQAGDGELAVTATRARFTWAGIERDRERLLAGVNALRSLRPAAGPYR